MPHLNVNAALHIAGAYQQLQSDTGPWFFGVALSAGWSETPPANGNMEQWRDALLPWNFAGDCERIVLFDAVTGAELGRLPRVSAEQAFAGLVTRIQDQARLGLAQLDPNLVWDGGAEAEFRYEVSDDASAGRPAASSVLHGPALLHTLTRLPAPIALGMSSVLYFECDAVHAATLLAVQFLAAVPEHIHDKAGAQGYDAGPIALLPDNVVRCDYGAADGPKVYSEALDLAGARSAGVSEVLKTYWLPVHAGGGGQLNDIDRVIAELLPAMPAVQFVSPQLLAADTTPWLRVNGLLPALDQAQAFWDAARTQADGMDQALDPAAARAGLLDDAFAVPGATVRQRLHDALRAHLTAQWTGIVAALSRLPEPLYGGLPFTFDTGSAASAWLDKKFPEQAPPQPDTANAAGGLPFCVGDPGSRLVYAGADDAPPVSGLRDAEARQPALGLEQISAIGVLVKRENRDWRLVTAGMPVAAEVAGPFDDKVDKDAWLPHMLPSGLTVAFTNALFSLDYDYDGAPMRTPDARNSVHNRTLDNQEPAQLDVLAPFRLHSPDLVTTAVTAREHCKAPPLRYGDRYQIAAFAIDKVGGLPGALAGARPWDIDWQALAALDPPLKSPERRFLRAALPGPVGLVHATPGMDAAWPLVPKGVALRALEAPAATWRGAAEGAVPALLVSADHALDGLAQQRSVRLVPPTVDEHILTRWAMPDTGQPAGSPAQLRLFSALKSIHAQRQDLLDKNAPPKPAPTGMFPHDPAIAGFLVTGHGVDRAGIAHPFPLDGADACVVLLAWPADAYVIAEDRLPVLDVVVGDGVPRVLPFSAGTNRATVVLPPGSYAIIEIHPLLSQQDAARFEPAVLNTQRAGGRASPYVALAPEILVAEHAISALPAAGQLYKALTLQAQAKSVGIVLEHCDDLAFVDSFSLQRQRWVWRNRPLPSPELDSGAGMSDKERRRLLASGLPAPVLSDLPDVRDGDTMRSHDELAGLDKGLADRSDHAARFPRERDGAGRTLLLVDTVDGADRAEYLRYGMRVSSRYAPLFKAGGPARPSATAAIGQETWRRLALPYRGSGATLRPPKVMAVIPLTQGFGVPGLPLAGPQTATPVLIVLDEVWFRDFGPGDRLEVSLALEKADIGEDALARRPYRTGGLPDHHLARRGSGGSPYDDPALYFRKRLVNEEEDAADPVLLDVFGPFGYSLDRSGNQALANATAFIAFPPPEVEPHFAMFVRLARVLDRPSQGLRSALTDAYPVYTLPDAGDLIRQDAGATGRVELDLATSALLCRDMALNCRPWTPAAMDGQTGAPADEAARKNYMYCMLVSEIVADGGRGLDAELPVAMLVLEETVQPGRCKPIPQTTLTAGRRYRGRVLELLMNGKEASRTGLADAPDLRAFWKHLLPARSDAETGADADAVAAIRRVSPPFAIDVER